MILQTKFCMVMQKRAWMTTFLFKESMAFLNKSIPSGVSFNDWHLLILDGHGNHVTLEAIKLVKKFGFRHDHITITHVTCIVTIRCACFQPLKTSFKKVRDVVMFKSNHMESNKVILIGWVGQALK
jgi:hypothetical protein